MATELLERDLEAWQHAKLFRSSKDRRGAGHSTVVLLLNPRSRVYVMNETFQDARWFTGVHQEAAHRWEITARFMVRYWFNIG